MSPGPIFVDPGTGLPDPSLPGDPSRPDPWTREIPGSTGSSQVARTHFRGCLQKPSLARSLFWSFFLSFSREEREREILLSLSQSIWRREEESLSLSLIVLLASLSLSLLSLSLLSLLSLS